MIKNALAELAAQGQSVWLDNITRDLIQRGKLKSLIEAGLRGITSNPTIFQKTIESGHAYDQQIAQLAGQGKAPEAIYEALTISDIQAACDQLQVVYEREHGADGFASIEVNPKLSRDTEGSIAEARRLWREVNRPNLMVKIPGTREGVPAVKECLSEGININITLLFSRGNHERVMYAYLEALESRLKAGQPIRNIASVASFFVSRVDTLVDELLEKQIASAQDKSEKERLRNLLGKAGIANAKLAYDRFRKIFDSDRFMALQLKGARVQRPLWASTSTKNPVYRDVMYVEELIGPNTVNTVPDKTLDALEDHAQIERTVDSELHHAENVMEALKLAGIRFDAVTPQLEDEGIEKFNESYDEVVAGVRGKLAAAR